MTLVPAERPLGPCVRFFVPPLLTWVETCVCKLALGQVRGGPALGGGVHILEQATVEDCPQAGALWICD